MHRKEIRLRKVTVTTSPTAGDFHSLSCPLGQHSEKDDMDSRNTGNLLGIVQPVSQPQATLNWLLEQAGQGGSPAGITSPGAAGWLGQEMREHLRPWLAEDEGTGAPWCQVSFSAGQGAAGGCRRLLTPMA